MLIFMKIRHLGAELFHAHSLTDSETDRQTHSHDAASSHFSLFYERAY